MTALAAGNFSRASSPNRRIQASNIAPPQRSTTRPRQNSRTIRGPASKLLNSTVTRPFSFTCAIVSTPDPPRSTYAAALPPRKTNALENSPFGETLIWGEAGMRVSTSERVASPVACA